MRKAITFAIFIVMILIFLSGCATTQINGVKVREKPKAGIDEETQTYTLITIFLAYGISYHFLHREQ